MQELNGENWYVFNHQSTNLKFTPHQDGLLWVDRRRLDERNETSEHSVRETMSHHSPLDHKY